MRPRLLGLSAILGCAIFTLALAGYFIQLRIVGYYDSVPRSSLDWPVAGARISNGVFSAGFVSLHIRSIEPSLSISDEMPTFHTLLGWFDAGWNFPDDPTRIGNAELAFPLWLIAVPSLIPPLIWLRKRRKRHVAGFEVVAVPNEMLSREGEKAAKDREEEFS